MRRSAKRVSMKHCQTRVAHTCRCLACARPVNADAEPGPVRGMGEAAGSSKGRGAEAIIVMLCRHPRISHRTNRKRRDVRATRRTGSRGVRLGKP